MGYKILVIDDDDALRLMLEEMLGYCGHEVFSAENGEVGVDIANNVSIDLVITDISMPEADGLEVTLELRKNHPEIKIIIITQHTSEPYMDHALAFGAHRYLKKPLSLDELEATIEELMENVRPR